MLINVFLMYFFIWVIKCIFYIFIFINNNIANNISLSLVRYKNRTIINIQNIRYKNLFKIDKISIKYFKHTTPYIKLNYASVYIDRLLNNSNNKFKLWNNNQTNTKYIIRSITSKINELKNISMFAKKVKLHNEDFVFRLFGLRIDNVKAGCKIKISKLKIYYKNIFTGYAENIKIIINSNDIHIDNVQINITEKMLRKNILEKTIAIIKSMPKNIDSSLPTILINNLKINITLSNYIAFNFNKIELNEKLIIHHILVKIQKKDMFWANDFIYNYTKSYPEIKNARLRLFNSTSDKIYKTLIYFRKRYCHFRKNKIVNKEFDGEMTITNNYLQTIDNDENICSSDIICKNSTDLLCSDINAEYIKNDYVNELLKNISNLKLIIEKFKIDLEKNKGSLHFTKFIYKQTDKYNQIMINRWTFSKNSVIYIDKLETNRIFIINFNDKNFDIFPYKTYVNLDITVFSEMFKVLLGNINRIMDIFINKNVHNKGYLFESFTIDSFYSNFNYTKNKFKLSRFIDGEMSQILNITGAQDINLLIDDLRISYPKNWDNILKKLLEKYVACVKKYNLDNILKKTSGTSVVTIKNLKSNVKYFSNKIFNSINK